MNINEIREYLENRINKCYEEEKENYNNDLNGKFISCEISGKYLLIKYQESGKIRKCKIYEPDLMTLEQIYYFWQIDSLSSAGIL